MQDEVGSMAILDSVSIVSMEMCVSEFRLEVFVGTIPICCPIA